MTLKHDTLAGQALKDLKDQGIQIPEKPGYDIPRLPVELTDMGDTDLMEMYSRLTAYADFIAVQVSCAVIDERQAEKRLQSAEQRAMVEHSTGGKSESRVTFARAQTALDPKVRELKGELDHAYAYRKLIEAMAGNIERDTFLVSRELTRRTSDVNRRSNRWGA